MFNLKLRDYVGKTIRIATDKSPGFLVITVLEVADDFLYGRVTFNRDSKVKSRPPVDADLVVRLERIIEFQYREEDQPKEKTLKVV